MESRSAAGADHGGGTLPLSNEILDQLLAGRDPKTVLQADGRIGELKKALAERMLNAEMDVHLANEAEAGILNHRNGSSPKIVLTPDGELTLSIPRDRHGRFDPTLIAKYRRRFPGFDDKIIAQYARGMSTPGYPGPCPRALRDRGLPRFGIRRHRPGDR